MTPEDEKLLEAAVERLAEKRLKLAALRSLSGVGDLVATAAAEVDAARKARRRWRGAIRDEKPRR